MFSLFKSDFKEDPHELYSSDGIKFEFIHTKRQKEIMDTYYKTFGDSKSSLAYILTTVVKNDKIYRKAIYDTQ